MLVNWRCIHWLMDMTLQWLSCPWKSKPALKMPTGWTNLFSLVERGYFCPQEPLTWSTLCLVGALPMTQGSTVSSVKWFGWAVFQKAAISKIGGQAVVLFWIGMFWTCGLLLLEPQMFAPKKRPQISTGVLLRSKWRVEFEDGCQPSKNAELGKQEVGKGPFLSSHSECNGPTQWKVIKIRCPWWSEECLCPGQNSRQRSDSHWLTLPSLHFCCFYPSDKHADRRVVESALSAQLVIIHLPLLMVNHRSFACLTYSLLLTYCKLFPNF